MRILMLIHSPNVDGPLPKHTPLLIKALQDLGSEVITSIWGRHKEHEILLEKIVGRLQDLLRVRKKLIAGQFDIMVVKTSHNWTSLSREIPLILLTRRLCPRIVLQMHGSRSDRMVTKGNNLFKLATRWLLQRCDAVLVLSTEEQHQWQQFFPQGNFYVVTNPFLPSNVDSSMELSMPWVIPMDCPVLLFVGRLIIEKGMYDLLESMPRILERTKCHLLIAGDGPEKAGLQKRINDLGLTQNITLLGYLKGAQLSSVYLRANMLVLPSYHYEGFPTVVTEAMSFGLPIVTTNIRGVADHLQEGVNALFVPSRDPGSLAEAILKLLGESDLRSRMNIANREKVKQFEPSVVGEKYHSVLIEILGERRNDGKQYC